MDQTTMSSSQKVTLLKVKKSYLKIFSKESKMPYEERNPESQRWMWGGSENSLS
jgi:hypothetical protein